MAGQTDGHVETVALTAEQGRRLLAMARAAIGEHLATGQVMVGETAVPDLQQRAGVFVTLRQKDDGRLSKAARLRGCIGHVEPDQPLWQIVPLIAIKAATTDPRFPPLEPSELDNVALEISVLSPLEPLDDVSGIELGVHGLVIESGWRRGLLLPQVPITFGWTKQEFLQGLCHKAGLPPNAWRKAKLWRFTTTTFEEENEEGATSSDAPPSS
jgi:uncharacterized protein